MPPASRRAFLVSSLAAAVVACSGGSTARPATTTAPGDPRTHRYGPSRWQVGDLYLPTAGGSGTTGGRHGVVVLFHGGFWRPPHSRAEMAPLAVDLAGRGWAVWNLDYRPVGEGGGWPATFRDVASGIDLLAGLAGDARLDLDRLVTVGWEAGGTFALWAAARHGLPAGAPGADPKVDPHGAVSMAGVNNLVAGWFEDLGGGAVDRLMGAAPDGPGDERYDRASPERLLPLERPQLLVHGAKDTVVPLEQSVNYANKAVDAGDTVDLVRIDGADHDDLLVPTGSGWKAVRSRLAGLAGGG